MPKASGSNPTIEETNADSFDVLLKTEDFKDFLRIATVTGSIPESKPTDLEQEKIVDQYKVWVDSGRPKPKMPESVKSGVEEIIRIYRRKVNGVQYLSYVVKGKSEQVGMETTVTYGKNGDGQEDKSIIIARDRKPVIKYTDKNAKELIQKAKRYHIDDYKLYFVYQTATVRVTNDDNFTGDFDSLMSRAMNKEII